jgi:ComF family protein
MNFTKELVQSFSHIFFPHLCAGCGSDSLSHEQLLCLHCLQELPVTDFPFHAGNPVEKIFWGRVDLCAASAQYYFTKNSALQHILHQFKYNGRRQLGIYFGHLMGEALQQSNRFTDIEALIPLPLFASKEKRRGYNQAAVLCEGIAGAIKIPVLKDLVTRTMATETQTHKNRVERWQNISGKFELKDRNLLRNKHVLLVDDVITTGATLDACATELLEIEGIRISIAALAYTVR